MGFPVFSLVTLIFEILETIIATIITIFAWQLLKKHQSFVKRKQHQLLLGLVFLVIHFFLDGVDTIVYEYEEPPRLLYTIIDTTETILEIIGAILLTIGLVSFGNYLMKEWESLPNKNTKNTVLKEVKE